VRQALLIAGLGAVLGMNQLKLSPVVSQLLDGGLGESEVAWLMSIYAVGGLPVALYVVVKKGAAGARRRLVGSFVLLAGAGLLAGLWPQPGFTVLLASRLVESIGFTMLAVQTPSLIAAMGGRDQPRAAFLMALWAMWMPLGQLVLFSVSGLGVTDFQDLWLLVAAATAGIAVLFMAGVGNGLGEPGAEIRPRAIRGKSLAYGLYSGAMYLMFSVAYTGLVTWLPHYMHATLATSSTTISLLMVGYAVTNLAGNLLAPRVARRAGIFVAISLGFGLTGILVAFLAVAAGPGSVGTLGALIWLTLGMTAAALFSVPIWIGASIENTWNYALLVSGRNLGILIGPLVFVAPLGRAGGWSGGFLTVAGVCFIALLATVVVNRLRGGYGR